MNQASEDVKLMLEAEAFGLVFETNLFIGEQPAKPFNCVTLFDTPSFPPDVTMDTSEKYFRSSVQIGVRNQDYVTGITLARNIMLSLHGRANETWGGTLYTVITAQGEPALLGYDDNKMPQFSINFNLQRR